MEVAIQYLEGTAARAGITAAQARTRLRSAFERIHFSMVLLGWDLPAAIIEACAAECVRHGAELYLWQPMLSGHGAVRPDRDSRVVALDGLPTGQADEPAEFTFMCPNQPGVRERALQSLAEALEGGWFQGAFLDRIRFPSPAPGPRRQLGCFCPPCRKAASQVGVDLEAIRGGLVRTLKSETGRKAFVTQVLGPTISDPRLQQLLEFRQASISGFVEDIAEAVRARGLKIGLDCFAPTLSRMVGQDLQTLSGTADWTKLMVYARANGPAALPFELASLANWLRECGESEQVALAWLREATGWELPGRIDAIRQGGLPASILTEEIVRGRALVQGRLLAGVELVEIPGVCQVNSDRVRQDAEAVRLARPDGVVLSWDLWHMPEWALELAGALYQGEGESRAT